MTPEVSVIIRESGSIQFGPAKPEHFSGRIKFPKPQINPPDGKEGVTVVVLK